MHTGYILIDKQTDWTSNDVTVYIRNKVSKIIKAENQDIKYVRVGHAGTLDPFATGLLIVGVGRQATRNIDAYKNLPKIYEATIKLGYTSDTYDSTGEIQQYSTTSLEQLKNLLIEDIASTLQTFIGEQQQLPPLYSAKKVHGKKMYELARKGVAVERKHHEIEIFGIELIEYTSGVLKIACHVSTGTYIRTLAHDIGEKLGVGAYCDELRRISIGPYSVDDAIDVKDITENNWTDFLMDV